jgi:MYXO-CTERM domain-containing protein
MRRVNGARIFSFAEFSETRIGRWRGTDPPFSRRKLAPTPVEWTAARASGQVKALSGGLDDPRVELWQQEGMSIRSSSRLRSRLSAALIFATSLYFSGNLIAPAARACGGTFCDSGPTAMPVDQTGENILFVMENGSVEAHIQIQVAEDAVAEKFAWVIPMLQVPTFSLGSQQLFTELLTASVPTYGYFTSTENCSSDGGLFPQLSGDDAASDSGDYPNEQNDVKVLQEAVVGAYEIAVIEGSSVDSVMLWLNENGFAQDEAARPILQEYIDERYFFVALKLRKDAGISEIQPIVLRYAGDMPCVPIRLTRIAAQEDMELRTFFLGNARVVPNNYRHILVNDLQIDWVNFGSNYRSVVSKAVDARDADGRAFLTEYAGTSDNVSRAILQDTQSWGLIDFASLDSPVDAISILIGRGILICEGYNSDGSPIEECIAQNSLIEPLLARYVPVPPGLTDMEFYGNMSEHVELIDTQAWKPSEFANDFLTRIVSPASRALELLQYPYLTRMYTTISPGEMIEDPMFQENPTLPEVSNIHQAQRYVLCDGRSWMELPDGTRVSLDDAGMWPAFAATMPYELEVRSLSLSGEGVLLHSSAEEVKSKLESWNRDRLPDGGFDDAFRWHDSGCACALGRNSDEQWSLLAVLFGVVGIVRLRRRSRWS